jgi:hypothetical protein
MYYKGCSNRDGFDAVFAGFCAVFRRGEQGWSSRDVLTGTVLTQCLQGSAQCFAGASRDGLAGMYCKGYSNRDGFDTVFAGFCESSKIK